MSDKTTEMMCYVCNKMYTASIEKLENGHYKKSPCPICDKKKIKKKQIKSTPVFIFKGRDKSNGDVTAKLEKIRKDRL